MGLEAMTKTEMLDILRGKKLLKAPENNDELLEGLKMLDTIFDEIADELEQSDRVVRCRDCKWGHGGSLRCPMSFGDDWFCADGEKMDEHFAEASKKVNEVSE